MGYDKAHTCIPSRTHTPFIEPPSWKKTVKSVHFDPLKGPFPQYAFIFAIFDRANCLNVYCIYSLSFLLSDPGLPGVRSMGPGVCPSLTRPFADLTDVSLAD